MSKIIALDNVTISPQVLLNLASFFQDEQGTCLLYSGGAFDSAKKSFLCLFPYDYIRIQGHKQWRYSQGNEKRTLLSMKNPWDALRALIPEFDNENPFPEWVGFLGYEMGAFSDFEKELPYQPAKSPDTYLQRCTIVLMVDHESGRGTLRMAYRGRYFLDEKQNQWIDFLVNKSNWPEFIQNLSGTAAKPEDLPLTFAKPAESLSSYVDKIEQIKELISAGEVYQINLSQQFCLSGRRNPYRLFQRLAEDNPAPFSAFLKMEDFAVVCSSPERFLKKEGDILETRPIKGTAPRGSTPEEDASNQQRLLASEKERAELLMITDLMRNDLGKVSLPGSVQTERLWACEQYTNVFHLIAVIRSRLKVGVHPVDVIRSCFPGGSITGCPKLRAMEVIANLEKRSRGVYTGAIGYIAGNGDFDFNIAIRTVVIHDDLIDIQLGGGIVSDSNPIAEYEETLHKGATIFNILGMPPAQQS